MRAPAPRRPTRRAPLVIARRRSARGRRRPRRPRLSRRTTIRSRARSSAGIVRCAPMTDICALLARSHRIAVLGIKTEAQADQPSFSVPKYLQSAGFEIVPVPVYYPEVTEILGQKVFRKLVDIPGEIDLVDVFRKPSDLAAHEADIL